MRTDDIPAFQRLLTDAMAFYRKDLSKFALGIWWQACQSFDLEQVSKAITAHALNPGAGKFAPMPADIVEQLQGTRTDRALMAWGKVYEAIKDVGGYASVAFDDPAIHAAIEDMGGWPKMCSGLIADLPHDQRRFCETYRAYATQANPPHVAVLAGVHAQSGNTAPPRLIGDPIRAQQVASGPSVSRSVPMQLLGVTS